MSAPEPVTKPAPELGRLAAAEPVPSVLPEEGIELATEVERYRAWLIDQALLQAGGNYTRAARLLGVTRTHLYSQRPAGGHRGRRSLVPARAASAPSPAAPSLAPHSDWAQALAARIDWAHVAELRSRGLNEHLIALKLRRMIGGNVWALEKVLRRHPPSLAAE